MSPVCTYKTNHASLHGSFCAAKQTTCAVSASCKSQGTLVTHTFCQVTNCYSVHQACSQCMQARDQKLLLCRTQIILSASLYTFIVQDQKENLILVLVKKRLGHRWVCRVGVWFLKVSKVDARTTNTLQHPACKSQLQLALAESVRATPGRQSAERRTGLCLKVCLKPPRQPVCLCL